MQSLPEGPAPAQHSSPRRARPCVADRIGSDAVIRPGMLDSGSSLMRLYQPRPKPVGYLVARFASHARAGQSVIGVAPRVPRRAQTPFSSIGPGSLRPIDGISRARTSSAARKSSPLGSRLCSAPSCGITKTPLTRASAAPRGVKDRQPCQRGRPPGGQRCSPWCGIVLRSCGHASDFRQPSSDRSRRPARMPGR